MSLKARLVLAGVGGLGNFRGVYGRGFFRRFNGFSFFGAVEHRSFYALDLRTGRKALVEVDAFLGDRVVAGNLDLFIGEHEHAEGFFRVVFGAENYFEFAGRALITAVAFCGAIF